MRKLNKPDKGQKATKQVVKQESKEEYAYNSVKKIMSRAQMRTEHFEGNESFIKKKKKIIKIKRTHTKINEHKK